MTCAPYRSAYITRAGLILSSLGTYINKYKEKMNKQYMYLINKQNKNNNKNTLKKEETN